MNHYWGFNLSASLPCMLGLKDCRSIYVSYLGSSLSLSLSVFQLQRRSSTSKSFNRKEDINGN